MNAMERRNNARWLAKPVGAPIECAEGVLERLETLAMRRNREWTRANNDAEYSKSTKHRDIWANIERQREAIETELQFFYCAEVTWPGLYPTVACGDGKTIYF